MPRRRWPASARLKSSCRRAARNTVRVISFPLPAVSVRPSPCLICRCFAVKGVNRYINSAMGSALRSEGTQFVFCHKCRSWLLGGLLSAGGHVKLLIERGSRRILGCHIVGTHASTLLHEVCAIPMSQLARSSFVAAFCLLQSLGHAADSAGRPSGRDPLQHPRAPRAERDSAQRGAQGQTGLIAFSVLAECCPRGAHADAAAPVCVACCSGPHGCRRADPAAPVAEVSAVTRGTFARSVEILTLGRDMPRPTIHSGR